MNPWDQIRWKYFVFTFALAFGVNVFGQSSLFDSSFQISGGADAAVNAILVLPDGKILVGGEFNVIAGKTNSFLARLQSDGQPDESFGSGTDGIVNRLLLLPDGKILVAGAFTNLLGIPRRGLGRLLADGTVDLEFDPGSALESDEVRTIAVQSDGKILSASEMLINFNLITRLSRFETNGDLDLTFIRTNSTAFGSVFALLPMTNGMFLAGGNVSPLRRVRSDGQIDADLSGLFTSNSAVFSLNQLANGNILVGGLLCLSGLNRTEAVAQLTSDGQWDSDFDADQFDAPLFGGYARSVLVQPDEKIVVAGEFYDVGGYWRRHIVRLDSQGHVDPCFDPGIGLGGDDGARSLAHQDDGRILVGGKFDSTMWAGTANIARFLPQGECDVTRIYLFPIDERVLVIATSPPGGTNLLQQSTNLLDWETIDTQLIPQANTYLNWILPVTNANTFFRVKKVF
jgi:uncharacterized delta-60 repeat protein